MSIVLYGQNVLRGVLEEKTTRVAEVVVSSVPPTETLRSQDIPRASKFPIARTSGATELRFGSAMAYATGMRNMSGRMLFRNIRDEHLTGNHLN